MKPWYAVDSRSARPAQYHSSLLTLQKGFDVIELAFIVELPEVFRLLCQLFPLRKRVPLVCNEV